MPDCAICRDPDFAEARVGWGCDGLAEMVQFRTLCSTCSGTGLVGGEPCPASLRPEDGEEPVCVKGHLNYRVCPTRALSGADSVPVLRFIAAYQAFDSHGILPVAGGWLDQTAHWEEGCQVAQSERCRLERVEEKYRERKRQSEEARNRTINRGRRS